MAWTQPGSSAGQVASPTPALQQQPRRPRRWARLLVAGMTLVVVASLAPRAHADGGDDMPLDFQFESPAELAGDLSLPDAAVDPGGGDHADGGGDATAGVVPTQDQGGGVWGTLDWGGGGDEPQRADAPVVAQADEERSVGTSPKGLAAEQEAESDVGRHGVVVGLDPKLTPEENMRDAIDGIY